MITLITTHADITNLLTTPTINTLPQQQTRAQPTKQHVVVVLCRAVQRERFCSVRLVVVSCVGVEPPGPTPHLSQPYSEGL